jgi:hypothetical protein
MKWLPVALFVLGSLVSAFGQTPENRKDVAILQGRTVSTEGSPLRKSILTLMPDHGKPGEEMQPYRAFSDSDGNFIFDGVEPGVYRLSGQHVGFLPSAYGAKRNSPRGTILTLAAGQEMKGIEFALTREGVIQGKVVDDDGDPVAYAQVSVMRTSYSTGKPRLIQVSGGQTDSAGEFKCPGLPAGRYLVNAKARQFNWFEAAKKTKAQEAATRREEIPIPTYYPGSTDAASAAPLDLRAGQELRGIDIRLRKAVVFRIKGSVSGGLPTGPGKNVSVFINRPGANGSFDFEAGARVRKDGSFELNDVAPGEYDLIVASLPGILTVLGRQKVQVESHDLDGVVVVTAQGGSLTGSVQWVDGASPPADGISAVQIGLWSDEAMDNPSGRVKDDGTFALDVSLHPYTLRVFGLPSGTYLKSAKLGERDVLANGLDFTGGIVKDTLEVVLSAAAGQLDGIVQDDKQQPAAGATLTLIPEPPDPKRRYLYQTANTDQNGQFSLKSIAPGKYRVYAWEDLEDGRQLDPEFLKPLEGLGVEITVAENGRQSLPLKLITTAQVELAQK